MLHKRLLNELLKTASENLNDAMRMRSPGGETEGWSHAQPPGPSRASPPSPLTARRNLDWHRGGPQAPRGGSTAEGHGRGRTATLRGHGRVCRGRTAGCVGGADPPASSPEWPQLLYGLPGSSTTGPTPTGMPSFYAGKGALEEAEYAWGGNLRGQGPENGTPSLNRAEASRAELGPDPPGPTADS